MLEMNKRMAAALGERNFDSSTLDGALKDIANSGFAVIDGCYFIQRLYDEDTNVSASDFPDKSGYEAFINHLHIDDFVDQNFLNAGLCYVQEVFKCWRSSQSEKSLIAIISFDETSLTVRLHVSRRGERIPAEDLEGYELEAVLVVDSEEQGF